jgi:hypothetical protein
VSAGISLRSISQNTIPIFEEHMARLRSENSVEHWMEMSQTEKAMIVALYRIDNAMHGHQSEAEIAMSKRKAKQQAQK